MSLGRDLESKIAIYFKALLFIVILILSAILNLLESSVVFRAVSLILIIWASARLYYFMFYVIEHYVDSDYKFSGIYSFLKYLVKDDKQT